MNRLLLVAVIAAVLSFASLARAASAVPLQFSYLGRVTDAAGVPLGNTTPVNRTVTFRIWDNATATAAANRLYSEAQTITIAAGEFSVLIGTGTPVAGETNTLALDAVFSGTDRFLGVTVDDGTAAVDPEISPRQQIMSTPFAFRSKIAETVASGAVTSAMIANNAVTATQIADSTIVSSKIGDGTVATVDLADGAINSAKILDGAIATADLANGAVTAAKLGADVGTWTTTAGHVYRTTGNLGVGTSTPTALISAGSAVGNNKIAVYDNGASGRMGFGYQSGQLRIHTNAATDKISFFNTEAGAAELLTITGAGNVGIGASSPSAKLHVAGNLHVHSGQTAGLITVTGVNPGLSLNAVNLTWTGAFGFAESAGAWSTSASSGDVVLRSSFGKVLLQSGHGGAAIAITTDNRVGIGTTAPIAPLHVSGGAALGVFFLGARVSPESTADEHNANFNAANATWGGTTHSIVSDLRIRASALDVTNIQNSSDARIKRIAGRSSGPADLRTLMDIEVTDYNFIDQAVHGRAPQKKVIAQQLERVFPQAVARASGVIPDVFRRADLRDGWVMLATDLRVGECVRLIGETQSGVYEVLEARPDRFRTAFKPPGEHVFVYGREVKDFASIDYVAVSMLNVSATQQIKEEKDAQIAALEARVKSLEAQNAEAQSRFAAIERRLNSTATAAFTASAPR